ncbi:hypothetical protein P8452_28449 [Trifolium repens]|nr:hypothetical protein P8452_28449 [Trifolium repens]
MMFDSVESRGKQRRNVSINDTRLRGESYERTVGFGSFEPLDSTGYFFPCVCSGIGCPSMMWQCWFLNSHCFFLGYVGLLMLSGLRRFNV